MAVDPLKGVLLPQPWRGWFERLRDAINNTATKIPGMTENNIFVADADGDLRDSGFAVPLGTIVDDIYVGERYITEAEAPEAGTEEGARPGSFRIGLFTEDDYAFFDENGKLILYGTSGIQLVTPLNHSSDSNRFAVLDGSGNLKYRTAAQLLTDLSGDAGAAFSMNSQKITSLATPTAAADAAHKDYVDNAISSLTITETVEQWAAERFMTEAAVPEAGTEPPLIISSPNGTRYTLAVTDAGVLSAAEI